MLSLIYLVDFILTKFVNYYEIRLLDAVNNLKCTIKLPPTGLLERITVLSDNIVTLPSELRKDLVYIVNFNALACSCFERITGKMCKHIHWAVEWSATIGEIFVFATESCNSKRKVL
ncbi:hypothetical protein NQ317_001222 [Molorchus minor]|uniref:SWIM-type domain-containing protein n=1 Tax=Molorchus minor TaxID=1323400 RepID=A0ABQ9JRR4_9CUCU|nr:hypothetical protein NQ317_001222 [Molorchus minor]